MCGGDARIPACTLLLYDRSRSVQAQIISGYVTNEEMARSIWHISVARQDQNEKVVRQRF